MSRCFPYPPPGYERNGAQDHALIESLKLQREREKAKKDRRKEKKREKKEKERAIESGKSEKKIRSHEKRDNGERSKADKKSGHHQKRAEDEAEHLEKSGVTEELEQPINSQNLYDSTDSTRNSNKRKQHSSSSDGSHNHGSILRIRLPLQKHRDPETLFSKDQSCSSRITDNIAPKKHEIAPRISQEQPCSTSGRNEVVAQEFAARSSKEPPSSTSGRSEILVQEKTSGRNEVVAQEFAARSRKEPPSSTSGRSEIVVQEKTETSTPFRSESNFTPMEAQYRDLIENWVPPPIQTELTDFDDQEWLFETKQRPKHSNKRFKAGSDDTSYPSNMLWPRAFYLPQADIQALPYTVPL